MMEELDKHPKATTKGVILLFGAALLAGIVIGGIASVISNFIYLVLIFPVIMGMAAGYVIKSVVISEKIRTPFVVVLTGLFATLIVYGSMHFFDYLQFRINLAKELQAQYFDEYGESAPRENVQAFIDYVLAQKTGSSGFLGFILLEAQSGVSLSQVGPGSMPNDEGINLGSFTWLYWLVEMGFIAWPSIDPAYHKSRELFCEHCNDWIPQGDHIGGIQPAALHQATALIKSRDFVGLAKMLQYDTTLPSIEFYTRYCRSCTTFPFYLMGHALSAGQGKARSKLFIVQTLNSSERHALTTELGLPSPTEWKQPS